MRRPNILLITTDQQRFDALGLNGNPVLQTTTLDALGSSGVNFTRAYSACPVCIPARRTLLTGHHCTTHGLLGYRDGVEYEPPFTLPGLLGDAGYQTELIGKLHLHPQRKRYGFDHVVLSETINSRPDSKVQSQNDYADWLHSKGVDVHPAASGLGSSDRLARPFHLNEEYHQTSWLADEAVQFLTKRRDPACPWFLHLSFWAPHPPLVPPQAYYDRYTGRSMPAPHIGSWVPSFDSVPAGIPADSATGPFSEPEMADATAGYYGLVHHISDRIAYVLNRYFEYGSDRTGEPVWILFTSDHGEMLGDHHLFRKSLPYEGSAHVPFFVSGRNVEIDPASSDALVCLEDVAPTLLDLAGVPIPRSYGPLDGRSLAPIVRGQNDSVRERIIGECSGQAAHHYIVEGRLKYIWFARTGEEQLFDLAADPYEQEDLSADTSALATFRKLLESHLGGRTDCTFDIEALKPLQNRPPSVFWGDRS